MTVQDRETTTDDYVSAWARWHRAHEEALAAPHGFLAITALHWLGEEPQRFPDVPGAWSTGPDGVTVVLDAGEELTLDGVALAGRHGFGAIPERGGVTATYGETALEICRRGGNDLLRPRHPDHPLRRDFHGTPAYAPDPRWRLTGRYTAFAEPRPTTVGSVVDGLEHVYDVPGEIAVEIDGGTHRLAVFSRGDGFLVLLTDETSGVTTYAANRALEVDPPGPDGEVVLDLNRAKNLPCAYTDLATCPLPPAGNHLPVSVEAGERIPYERGGQA